MKLSQLQAYIESEMNDHGFCDLTMYDYLAADCEENLEKAFPEYDCVPFVGVNACRLRRKPAPAMFCQALSFKRYRDRTLNDPEGTV